MIESTLMWFARQPWGSDILASPLRTALTQRVASTLQRLLYLGWGSLRGATLWISWGNLDHQSARLGRGEIKLRLRARRSHLMQDCEISNSTLPNPKRRWRRASRLHRRAGLHRERPAHAVRASCRPRTRPRYTVDYTAIDGL